MHHLQLSVRLFNTGAELRLGRVSLIMQRDQDGRFRFGFGPLWIADRVYSNWIYRYGIELEQQIRFS